MGSCTAGSFLLAIGKENKNMNDLSYSMVRAIDRYQTIEVEGLHLYPIRVMELDEFVLARPAIEFLQQSLPVTLISKPLLQAFYQMDFDAAAKGEPGTGLFFRSLLFLLLALRAGEGQSAEERLGLVSILPDERNQKKLKSVRIQTGSRTFADITPIQFQRLRPILAAQNGIELVSESANPELVQAEKDLAEMKAPKLRYEAASVKASISLISGISDVEMDEWPVLRFQRQKDAVVRMMGYLNCGMAEAQGAKWPHGNPYPSPLYDREIDYCGGVIDMASFAGGAGMRAVKNAGSKTT